MCNVVAMGERCKLAFSQSRLIRIIYENHRPAISGIKIGLFVLKGSH